MPVDNAVPGGRELPIWRPPDLREPRLDLLAGCGPVETQRQLTGSAAPVGRVGGEVVVAADEDRVAVDEELRVDRPREMAHTELGSSVGHLVRCDVDRLAYRDHADEMGALHGSAFVESSEADGGHLVGH